MLNAKVRRLASAFTDPKMLVLSNDLADIATKSTQFIFDALNPTCYLGGALPAIDALVAPAASVFGVTITGAGAGGTDGTFDLIFSSGGAAGTFTVKGGAVTAIDAAGGSYNTRPSLNFGRSAGLTGVNYQVQLGSLLNLVRSPDPITAWPSADNFAGGPKFDGKGWVFANGSTYPLTVTKRGTPLNRVCEPPLEGFVDFLEIAWCKPTAFALNQPGPYQAQQVNGGWSEGGAGPYNWYTVENSINIGAIAFGSLVQLAKLVRFNVAANTSTITPFIGANGSVIKGTTSAGKAPTAYTANWSPGACVIGGRAGSPTYAFTGPVYRIVRDMVGKTGLTDDDVLAIVKRDYAYGSARF